MMERSASLPKMASQSRLIRQNSLRIIDQRLKFPIPGDSSLFSNVGRKHFENHSDRMLKIILPEKFAVEKPLIFKREASLPAPHLARHVTEIPLENQKNYRQVAEVKKYFPKEASLRDKIEDELDKMKKTLEKQKKPLPKITINDTRQPNPTPQRKEQKYIQPKISTVFSNTPVISAKQVVQPRKNQSQLLYNPENKEKYDAILKSRWLSPTNLSTALSII